MARLRGSGALGRGLSLLLLLFVAPCALLAAAPDMADMQSACKKVEGEVLTKAAAWMQLCLDAASGSANGGQQSEPCPKSCWELASKASGLLCCEQGCRSATCRRCRSPSLNSSSLLSSSCSLTMPAALI